MATVNSLKEQTKKQPQSTHVSVIKALLNNSSLMICSAKEHHSI